MNTETENFGEHFMLDGYGGDVRKLNDKSIVERCMNELLERLGMHKALDPVILHLPGNDKKDPGGWSGFVIIFESHISIHTFPERGFVSADVYTCKNGMDTGLIKNIFTDAFALKDIETNFVKRGTKYPSYNIR